jgi:hypothetical protein
MIILNVQDGVFGHSTFFGVDGSIGATSCQTHGAVMEQDRTRFVARAVTAALTAIAMDLGERVQSNSRLVLSMLTSKQCSASLLERELTRFPN